MQQIFCFGSSLVYGTGSSAWWGDMLKQSLHQKMYGDNWIWEKIEIFNFWQSGSTIEFVEDTYAFLLDKYGRDWKKIAIINVWWNNSKARVTPDGYVSSLEEYVISFEKLLTNMTQAFDVIIFVGAWYVDESKVYPKVSPFDGKNSYFSNERRWLFDQATKELCKKLWVYYIWCDILQEDWIQKYLYKDGLHPNILWYRYFFNKLEWLVYKILGL